MTFVAKSVQLLWKLYNYPHWSGTSVSQISAQDEPLVSESAIRWTWRTNGNLIEDTSQCQTTAAPTDIVS